MKKLVLFFALLFSAGAVMAQTDCADLFISEYVEGWYNNKSLEIYNPTNAPITMDNTYRIIRWDNGKTTSDTDPLYVFGLTGTIQPYEVIVIVQDTTKPGQDTMVWLALRKKATLLAPYDYGGTTPGGNCVFWNGDDAISLQKKQNNGTWKDIDIFGEIGVRPLDWQGGTTGAWTDTAPYWRGTGAYLTKDQTLIRKKSIKYGIDKVAMNHYGDSIFGTPPNQFPYSFNAFMQYDSMPANFFDSLGFHRCDCKPALSVGEIQQAGRVVIQPNPVTDGQFTVISTSPISLVEVVSVVGQTIYSREFAARPTEVKIKPNVLTEGVYLVKIRNIDNQTIVKKIIIR